MRLSSGSTDIQSDQVPDIRGFAVKVFGVEGPDARDGSPAECQDFLLIPQDPFGLTSWQFTKGVQAIATGHGRSQPGDGEEACLRRVRQHRLPRTAADQGRTLRGAG